MNSSATKSFYCSCVKHCCSVRRYLHKILPSFWLPSGLSWCDGCILVEDSSRHSETLSTARCSLWSSHLVLEDYEKSHSVNELISVSAASDVRSSRTIIFLFGIVLKLAPLLFMKLSPTFICSQNLPVLSCKQEKMEEELITLWTLKIHCLIITLIWLPFAEEGPD